MAGISVPQYEIFKIGSNKLEYYDWNLTISRKDAYKYQEIVSLFESQGFRMVANKILHKNISEIDFKKIFLQVIIEKRYHFAKVTSKKGVVVNGKRFRRFVGTNGGLKNDTIVLCNVDYIDDLNKLCDCNRNKEIKMVPAKFESYKALTLSASQPICEPNGILVVPDCFTEFHADVIYLNNDHQHDRDKNCDQEPTMTLIKNKHFTQNASDGFNLCTIEYMKRIGKSLELDYTPTGVCLRNAFLKGMLYPFPIYEFIEEYNGGNYAVKDVWGNDIDIRKCDMILTESSLKLWSSYGSIDEYINAYRENGYQFSVTKIASPYLEEERELNYQYLQSYEFSDEDIAELCRPTIDYLKDAMCGDYDSTIRFLGINEQSDVNSWQHALYTNDYMLKDPYIIDSIHRYIKKKMNDAKTGKLIVTGNYQVSSGDPFALMQSICGLEVTGLLRAGECYSKFWVDKNEDEIVVFRSPMTSHNNIRKCMVNHSKECQTWYKYMNTVMIINSFDSFCMAENGQDHDGDLNFSTNNSVLKKRYRNEPAIECQQKSAEKTIITEANIKKTNKNGMSNKVGTITNRVTSMFEVRARFRTNSDEYKELSYRITCGQLYQQDEIDRIKGIVSIPMPKSWYSKGSCNGDEFNERICANVKPYFMIYIYPELRQKYKNYITECNSKCRKLYGYTVDDLVLKEERSLEEENFLLWYYRMMPVGLGNCTMNRICRYVEQELDGYKSQLKQNSNFDYNIIKVKRRCTEEHRTALKKLEQEYTNNIKEYKMHRKSNDDFDIQRERIALANRFKTEAKNLCPNDDERMNIILDITYGYKGNRQYCWDTIGELIVKRLHEMKEGNENVHT